MMSQFPAAAHQLKPTHRNVVIQEEESIVTLHKYYDTLCTDNEFSDIPRCLQEDFLFLCLFKEALNSGSND